MLRSLSKAGRKDYCRYAACDQLAGKNIEGRRPVVHGLKNDESHGAVGCEERGQSLSGNLQCLPARRQESDDAIARRCLLMTMHREMKYVPGIAIEAVSKCVQGGRLKTFQEQRTLPLQGLQDFHGLLPQEVVVKARQVERVRQHGKGSQGRQSIVHWNVLFLMKTLRRWRGRVSSGEGRSPGKTSRAH
jgi:hypothetical protein